MKVTLLAVGRLKGPFTDLIDAYLVRAGHYWRVDVIEVDQGSRRGKDAPAVLAAESERIIGRLPEAGEVVALTRDGRSKSSRELCDYLSKLATEGSPGVTFVIGGAFGLHRDVLQKARWRLSLSAMTLPHEMARLLLVEQLYRAGSIARGEPYHKGP